MVTKTTSPANMPLGLMLVTEGNDFYREVSSHLHSGTCYPRPTDPRFRAPAAGESFVTPACPYILGKVPRRRGGGEGNVALGAADLPIHPQLPALS